MAFYEKFVELKVQLENVGHIVYAPELEFETQGKDTSMAYLYTDAVSGSLLPKDDAIWVTKGEGMQKHFRAIDTSDAILVTNYEKNGVLNYIGGNTFLEMGYAFGTGKKIYLLNELPESVPYREEILGMQPTVLLGDISKLR